MATGLTGRTHDHCNWAHKYSRSQTASFPARINCQWRSLRADIICQRARYRGNVLTIRANGIRLHASTRTKQLYDRRHDEMSLDKVEWIRV